jgi:ATP-dependent helicase/nuclease subunit B
LLETHRERRAVELARALDASPEPTPSDRPEPAPSPEQRDVPIAITALDTLRSDPFQFYARAILGLRRLDALDEEPSAAWKGTIVHAILERWHRQGGSLTDTAHAVLDEANIHPVMRSLWLPRLLKGLEWVEAELAGLEGREVIAVERKGEMVIDGVRIHGRADRIDRLSDGTLAIVDYKTGNPPSAKRVKEGFSLQLGLVGMMAEMGGIEGVSGTAVQFEYWSLAKKAGKFGFRASPVKTDRNRAEIAPAEFTSLTDDYLHEAITRWIKGSDPFTARLVPNLEVYGDYDQLMRLEEWLGREEDGR